MSEPIKICDYCLKPWAGCHGVCAERELSLKDRLEFAIPPKLTATAHVGAGGAGRAAIAAELLPVVEAEISAALQAFEVAQRPHVVPQVLYNSAIQLRDEARDEVRVLQERIQKVRAIRDEIECTNCEHEAKFHDNGNCDVLGEGGQPCRCTWGPGNIAEAIDAALDGTDEEQADGQD